MDPCRRHSLETLNPDLLWTPSTSETSVLVNPTARLSNLGGEIRGRENSQRKRDGKEECGVGKGRGVPPAPSDSAQDKVSFEGIFMVTFLFKWMLVSERVS